MRAVFIVFLFCSIGVAVIAQPVYPRQLSYRYCQSPVRNQGDRGTCTAFAIAACLEVLPGVPANVSEQYVYAGLQMLNYGDTANTIPHGGNLVLYGTSLKQYGAMHESKMPYDKKQLEFTGNDHHLVQLIRESQTGPVSMYMKKQEAKFFIDHNNQFVAIEGEAAKDINAIKALFNNGYRAVACSYTVSPTWFEYEGKSDCFIKPEDAIYVFDSSNKMLTFEEAKAKYGTELYSMVKNEQLTLRVNYTGPLMGHAITIAGYNEKGFIIKNSWGTSWGDKGYGIISYEYHRLLARRYFAVKDVSFKPASVTELPPLFTDLRLKVIPQQTGLSLSVFTVADKTDPSFSSVKYNIYEEVPGKKKLLQTITVPRTAYTEGICNNAFTTHVLKGKIPSGNLQINQPALTVEIIAWPTGAKTPLKRWYKRVKWVTEEYEAEAIKK
jgi:Papain family cysteine protease